MGRYDMEQGIRPDGCTCEMMRGPVWEDAPQPAEWQQADDCPVHPVRTVHAPVAPF